MPVEYTKPDGTQELFHVRAPGPNESEQGVLDDLISSGNVRPGSNFHIVTNPAPEATPIDAVRAFYKQRVDEDAEEIRLKFITPGDGKSLSYREVHAEAVEILSDPVTADALATQAATDPDYANMAEETFPVIYPDIGVQGATLSECANIVRAQVEAFQKVENVIKKITYSGKTAINAAATKDQVETAYATVNWDALS